MATPTPYLDTLLAKYGDLVFDLCEAMLGNSSNAQRAFRDIFKALRHEQSKTNFVKYERPWVLRTAWGKLESLTEKYTKQLSPSEQIELDSKAEGEARMKHFGHYFHRLSRPDQFLLLLREKHKLPYSEIAAILHAPEDSIKIQRQHALRTLEEWLWVIPKGL
ncbi:sigma-70 family RNA polymerase sigma factor [Bdellovibrionota bacterium FG-2]